MGKAAKVLLAYYIFLVLVSLLFSVLNFKPIYFDYAGGKTEFNPIWVPTIIGGMIALKLTLPPRSFKLFVIVYCILWILRFALLYIGNRLGVVVLFNQPYHFEKIFNTYYKNVSRLDTHLPFVLYWFANYLFTIVIKQQQEKKETAQEPEKELKDNS